MSQDFFHACEFSTAEEVAEKFSSIQDINIRKNNGFTGLMLACSSGNQQAVEWLAKQPGIDLEKSAGYNMFTYTPINALTIACGQQNSEILKILLHAKEKAWNGLKYLGDATVDKENRNIIRAEIFLRSAEKNAKKLVRLTISPSYKLEEFQKSAQKEAEFVKMRAIKIYANLKKEEHKNEFIENINYTTGLTKEDLEPNKYSSSKTPLNSRSSFIANIGSNCNIDNATLEPSSQM